jgi:hypothetical protein
MIAHQINLSIFPMAEALPDSRLNDNRIEFAARTGRRFRKRQCVLLPMRLRVGFAPNRIKQLA